VGCSWSEYNNPGATRTEEDLCCQHGVSATGETACAIRLIKQYCIRLVSGIGMDLELGT